MKKFLLFLSVILSAFAAHSQDVVLEKDVDEQYQEEKGPNMKRYGHFYGEIGLPVPYGEFTGAKIDIDRSDNVVFGYRYKFKLLSFFAVGMDLSHNWSRYGIMKDQSVPVSVAFNPLSKAGEVDKLSLCINSFAGEAYARINIGKRGNTVGNFIDAGIREEIAYTNKFIIREKAPDGDYYDRSKSVERNLAFLSRNSTLLSFRAGIDKYALYLRYRLSDIITGGYSSPELTRYTAGFEFAF